MNGTKKRIGAAAVRAQRAGPGIKRANLQANLRSDLHEAGIEALNFFETMVNPEDSPAQRIPDSHSAMTAVFKTPFVVDLPYSGVWNPSAGTSSIISFENPVDGYSEVVVCPGSSDCYFHTLGVSASPWTPADTLDANSHNFQMLPTLSTPPVGTDVVGGRTQLVQGLKAYNVPGADHVAVLPKLDAIGHSIFEAILQPLNVDVDSGLNVLLGFVNAGIEASTRTTAHLTLRWDSGPIVTFPMEIASTGDNNTAHSSFYIFQATLPVANDFVISFYVEVDDIDMSSNWKFSMASTGADGYGITLPSHSACSFALVDAPEMDDLSETQSERTSALTTLLTYMGSSLQNGGQIAGARLGMGLSPLRSLGGDVYKTLASLPFYNDDFALQEGIYGWWLPDSIQEHFFVPYRRPRSNNLHEDAVLQFAAHRDNPNQTVRLKIIQNLEIVTRSRLYSAKAGPNNPSYGSIIGLLKAIPAITINKNHISILSKAFNFVKGWITKPANFKKLLKVGASAVSRLVT